MTATRFLEWANRALWVSVFVLGAALVIAAAQSKPAEAPMLSTEQKQAIQILAQRIELSQLRAQAAETDYRAATAELGSLLKSLNRDGWDLNLQTLAYVKKAPPAVGGTK